ncbi:hypothetical protein KUTeg_000844 [Tegillarca granosa]|uniref:C-type lectin domain-containing protein n=1 Tax=Tegillarca granosa TaxID=220873 RepID=A0ABQ9FYQ1_TEGGR|nr:hypothetical protein KUTeg_000844 [Tegillarca granosa]
MLFSGSCYSLRRQLKTWHDAMLDMHKMNGTDVTTHDFWIGGTDADVEGSWTYGSTGSIFGFTDWYQGEPDNYKNQDCAGLYRFYDFKWDDGDCIQSVFLFKI